MRFTKMQGCGNDYVVIDAREERADQGARELTGRRGGELAKRLCDRHFGIGADGLLLVKKGRLADIEMEMYNPDGSRGEMCGNGIRCVGKYVWERGIIERRRFTVESMGAVRQLEVLGESEGALLLRVDMGVPLLQGEVTAAGKKVSKVSMGNPHAVLLLERDEAWEVEHLGPLLEKADCFPDRTNVEFVRAFDRGRLVMRVWERGVGETLACGTGACAGAAVCMQKGLTDEKITVKLLGGELVISRDPETGQLSLLGPAVTLFEGRTREILT